MQNLIDAYNRGWDDCFDGTSHVSEYLDPMERRAYAIGWDYYIIGDDLPSVDYASDEEILKRINAPFA